MAIDGQFSLRTRKACLCACCGNGIAKGTPNVVVNIPDAHRHVRVHPACEGKYRGRIAGGRSFAGQADTLIEFLA